MIARFSFFAVPFNGNDDRNDKTLKRARLVRVRVDESTKGLTKGSNVLKNLLNNALL